MTTRKGTRPSSGALWAALALALAGAAAPPRAGAFEYVPLYNISLMGGQYFFQDTKSSLNGNAVANAAPAIKFNDRWTLLPVYHGIYQGTKQVSDSVGSGTLFQQMMSHRVSVTGLHSLENSTWRLKPSASYKMEYMKETRDETWGKGLFDYRKVGVGFETENVYKDPFTVRIGYDFFYVHFPHFQSLESKAGVDPSGNPLGRETAGTQVLDTHNHQLSVSFTRPYPYDKPVVSLQGGWTVAYQFFPDQPVIDKRGQPLSYHREDVLNTLSFSVSYPRPVFGGAYKLLSRFGLGYAHNESDQNSFDAGRLKFVDDAYSYYTLSFGPSVVLAWGDDKLPTYASLGVNHSRTYYTGRLAQDASGAYLGDYQHQNRTTLSVGYSVPIAPNFYLKAQTSFLWATSNMAYERSYPYTYRTANYLIGFNYDY